MCELGLARRCRLRRTRSAGKLHAAGCTPAPRNRHGVQAVQPARAHDRLGEGDVAAAAGQEAAEGAGGAARRANWSGSHDAVVVESAASRELLANPQQEGTKAFFANVL